MWLKLELLYLSDVFNSQGSVTLRYRFIEENKEYNSTTSAATRIHAICSDPNIHRLAATLRDIAPYSIEVDAPSGAQTRVLEPTLSIVKFVYTYVLVRAAHISCNTARNNAALVVSACTNVVCILPGGTRSALARLLSCSEGPFLSPYFHFPARALNSRCTQWERLRRVA